MKKAVIIFIFSMLLTGCATYTDSVYQGKPEDKPTTKTGHVLYFIKDVALETLNQTP